MTQSLRIAIITSRQNLHRGKTHFTAHFRTMIRRMPATDRKRRALFRGSRKRIKAQLCPRAKIDGLRSEKAIESRMRNGKTQDLSEQTIGNTCLATNVQNPI